MARRGLTNKGERSRETYGENADMGRRECMFVIERSPGDRDETTWVGDRVTRCVRDRRYPERYEIYVWMEADNMCVPDG